MKNTWKSVKSFGRNVAAKSVKACALVAAGAAVVAGTAGTARADLSIEPLTTAITSNVTLAETLIGAGLVVTALFIGLKIIKKGASKIG